MATWNSRGLRGSSLEEMINFTNETYRKKGIALIQKVPTPIKPITIDKTTRHITLGYFDKKSSVDYIGVVQGVPICFDAKECHSETFSLQNIHEHQYEFMKAYEHQNAVSFIILSFTEKNETYYVPFRDIESFYMRGPRGGRKSVRYDEIDKTFLIKGSMGVPLHYLQQLQMDLQFRD